MPAGACGSQLSQRTSDGQVENGACPRQKGAEGEGGGKVSYLGDSRWCFVGDWTCFNFLMMFHLSSKRLLPF